MTRTVLPASTFPDVLIANGVTYVALPTPQSLEIYSDEDDGEIGFITSFPIGSWPRLFAHATGILVAYKTGDDECLTVANITTGVITRTGIPAFWNSPICWRDDGYLCVQATTNPITVWGGMWPTLPAAPAIRQGVGTGLAQWIDLGQGLALKTWDELGVTAQPVWLKDAYVAQYLGEGGGINVTLGKASGMLGAGGDTSNPRPALATDGSLSIVHWVQGSRVSDATVLYQGVTAADLKPAPPVMPTIPPFTRKMILASYDSGKAKGDNGIAHPGHSVLHCIEPSRNYPYFDTEQEEPVSTHPCAMYADVGAVINAILESRVGDAIAFNVYPTASHPLTELRRDAITAIELIVAAQCSAILVGCAWNRLGTLSDQLVLDGMALVRDLADEPGVIGVEWFGLNRGTSLGYFKPIYQDCVDLFVSPGWPDWPAVIPPEDYVYLTFKTDQDRKDFANLSAKFYCRLANEIPGPISPNTGLIDPQGQTIWETMDRFNAVYPPPDGTFGCVPIVSDVAQLAWERKVEHWDDPTAESWVRRFTAPVLLQR